MTSIGGNNPQVYDIMIKPFAGELAGKIEKIDQDGNDNLSAQEVADAADADGDGKVTEAEADNFVEEMRKAAGEDSGIDAEVFDKLKEAAMDPVSSNIEFDIMRARYASVFCTRF